jgi:uncharacterized protein YjbI with pentapeptide repeats
VANEEHLAILKSGVEAWNKWREENSKVVPDLSGADLSGANLRQANLTNTNITKANLSNADLEGAELKNADLTDANLQSAGLEGVDLSSLFARIEIRPCTASWPPILLDFH